MGGGEKKGRENRQEGEGTAKQIVALAGGGGAGFVPVTIKPNYGRLGTQGARGRGGLAIHCRFGKPGFFLMSHPPAFFPGSMLLHA